jgi:lipase chaperone LimK
LSYNASAGRIYNTSYSIISAVFKGNFFATSAYYNASVVVKGKFSGLSGLAPDKRNYFDYFLSSLNLKKINNTR